MTPETIVPVLQAWLAQRTGRDFMPDESHLDAGVMDSFDVMEFTLFCEERFGVRFESEDLAHDDFRTVSGVARRIALRAVQAAG